MEENTVTLKNDVDADTLHNELLKLPAETYLSVYHKMQDKICGYPHYLGYAVNQSSSVTKTEGE